MLKFKTFIERVNFNNLKHLVLGHYKGLTKVYHGTSNKNFAGIQSMGVIHPTVAPNNTAQSEDFVYLCSNKNFSKRWIHSLSARS